MAVRELTAADLGDEVLLDLIRNDDPLGVLSIYVDGGSTATDRGAAIDIKNRLVELERGVAYDGSPQPCGGAQRDAQANRACGRAMLRSARERSRSRVVRSARRRPS